MAIKTKARDSAVNFNNHSKLEGQCRDKLQFSKTCALAFAQVGNRA